MTKIPVRSFPWRRPTACAGAALLAFVLAQPVAQAGSLTPKDIQIFAKAVGFLDPPPSGPVSVAIVYNAANPASKPDADAIATAFGDGLKAGAAILKPKVVSVQELGTGSGFVAVIPAIGALNDTVSALARTQHLLCATADDAAVIAGNCVMSVRSDPKVEIGISKADASSTGVRFSAAFLLMAHER